MPVRARHIMSGIRLRAGGLLDLEALTALETTVFSHDRISRRSFRGFLTSLNADLVVAEHAGALAGYALVLRRPNTTVSRLYSIAVAPANAGRGLGSMLLGAAERAALRRGSAVLRLEVHAHNTAAIAWYRRSGYVIFDRHIAYYGDRGDALRLQKPLAT